MFLLKGYRGETFEDLNKYFATAISTILLNVSMHPELCKY